MKRWALLLTLAIFTLPFISEAARERVVGMSIEVYDVLTTAQTLFEHNEFDKATALLKESLNKKRSDYESAHLWQMIGVMYQQQDKFNEALQAYQKAIGYPKLPNSLMLLLYKRLSQLNMAMENYAASLDYAKKILPLLDAPDGSVHILIAQASYFLNDLAQAQQHVEKALEIDTAAGSPPRESWLLLANAIYFEKKDFDNMLAVQYRLLQHYPKDKYLINLAAIYGELEQLDKQLALIEAVYEGGTLSQRSHLHNLASLLLMKEVPYKAARILEKAMDDGNIEINQTNLERLAQAWQQAGELSKAIAPQRQAAEISEDGQDYLILANIHIRLTQWQQAIDAIVKALKKGHLEDPGTAQITRGMAEFNVKNYQQAIDAFTLATQHEKSRVLAERWLEYIDAELEKKRALEES